MFLCPQVIYLCPKDYYGLIGEMCADCTTALPGAKCPGGETTNDLVVALPGWWRFNVSGSSVTCGGQPGREATCPYLAPCLPVSACLGANTCDKPYTGDRCGTCATGFFRQNGSCSPCPSSIVALIVIIVLVLIAGAAAGGLFRFWLIQF